MTTNITDWLQGRLPEDWFTAFDVVVDREEITVHGTLPSTDVAGQGEAGRIQRFRESTREQRIGIARELEDSTGRKVAWTVTCGGTTTAFTRLAVPVMTRLAQPQRRVLDTLVESGVARSRSEALAWCVKLVEQHAGQWLGELDAAMEAVRTVREQGPA
jgi:hypothetical protein